jgi:ribosomal protein L23
MRQMDDAMIATQFENLDRRLARVEQILPALATKDDLKALTTKEELRLAVERLATREELHRAVEPLATREELHRAVEPLATKEELRRAVEPLATKEELRRAVEPLATREELRALEVTLRREIREEGDRSRRHMEIITEAQRDDIRMLAEHLSAVMLKLEER